MMEYPALVFALSLALLWLAVYAGTRYAKGARHLAEDDRTDLGVILTATLTLLGLLIGFSFSMAITRYDQRKDLEAAEANAIGTELARAGLLPSDQAGKVRELLKLYLGQRLLFYTTRDGGKLGQINTMTARLQSELWSAVQEQAARQPNPIVALVASGMNDVLNSQAYTQAAWWNRIPIAAWVLMMAIAVCCNALLGYTGHHPECMANRLFVFPLIVAIAFFLIADIDSPRGGVIRVHPLNLESVARPLSEP